LFLNNLVDFYNCPSGLAIVEKTFKSIIMNQGRGISNGNAAPFSPSDGNIYPMKILKLNSLDDIIPKDGFVTVWFLKGIQLSSQCLI
jgi:hypothetical protein